MIINLPSREITAVTFGLIDAVVTLLLRFAQKEEGSVCVSSGSLCKPGLQERERSGHPVGGPPRFRGV